MIAEILAILVGIGLHQTRHIIDNLHTDSAVVKRLSSYGVGYIGILPVLIMFLIMLGVERETRTKVALAYLGSGTMTGIGVFIGYVLESLGGSDGGDN